MTNLRLVPLNERGKPAEPIPGLPDIADEIGLAHARLYAREGWQPPWLGYFAVVEGRFIGSCGFKSPPRDGEVEIAYFTLPPFEGRRYASLMAAQLVQFAEQADPGLTITAQTLPVESASTAILKRLHFILVGTVQHPEDGPVWHWQRLSRQTP